jgi:hypothetical protein
MNKMICVPVLVAGVVLAQSSAALAQPPVTESPFFVSIGLGGSLQTESFTHSSTFVSSSETGTIESNQNVGRGFLFDVTGGYHFTEHAAVALGVWTTGSDGAAGVTAAIPDPLFFGRFTTVTASLSDLPQRTVGLNIQFVWTMPLAERMDLAIYGGPSIIHVRQDIGSVNVTPDTQTVTPTTLSESKTTAKAGNVGFDLRYLLTGSYGANFFLRYAGGDADLPSVDDLTVGGFQMGAGLHYRF